MSGLEQFMAFAATARHGSFAAAAREQGVVPSTLAKAVARLEAELGVTLFHRTTRQVRLSPDGERLFERCQRVLAEIEELRAEASGARQAARGELLVSAPVLYGKRFVLPVLAALLPCHPGLRLELRLSDQYLDLVREGIDVAVRIGHLRDSSLVARRVDQQSLVLCASAAYLARHGTPRRVEDLQRHQAIAFRLPSTGRDRPWQFRQRGSVVEVAPQAQVRINETETVVEAIRHGLGLCQLPDNVVADELARGELVEVLPTCRPAPMPISVVVASGRLLPARVRVAIEALETLRQRGRGSH
jgi:LysR family transcriptional regulator, regulator for bpeEF and oprC